MCGSPVTHPCGAVDGTTARLGKGGFPPLHPPEEPAPLGLGSLGSRKKKGETMTATDTKKTKSETRQRQAAIRLRVTDDERAAIESRAERAGLTVAGYLRAVVFGKDTPQPRAARRATIEAATLQRLLAELGKIGSNLNQIARRLNQGKDDIPAPIFAELAAELRAALRELLQALGKEPPA